MPSIKPDSQIVKIEYDHFFAFRPWGGEKAVRRNRHEGNIQWWNSASTILLHDVAWVESHVHWEEMENSHDALQLYGTTFAGKLDLIPTNYRQFIRSAARFDESPK